MSTTIAKSFVGFALMIAVASCASAQRAPEAAPGVAEASRTREACPPGHEHLLPAGSRAAPSGKEVRILPKDGGWTGAELLDMISRTTGRSILYEASKATFKQATVYVCGVHVIREIELFDWLQAVLSFHELALVRVGPNSPDGSEQWIVMDQADPGRE